MENWWKKIWWNADLKKISNAIIDENVDIHLVRVYATIFRIMHGCLCKMWFKERKKLIYGHVQCATITLIKKSLLFVNLVLNGIISTVKVKELVL